jgi:hypothetical protein
VFGLLQRAGQRRYPVLLRQRYVRPGSRQGPGFPLHNYSTTIAFSYVNPGAGNCQLVSPNTKNGKIAGVDYSTLMTSISRTLPGETRWTLVAQPPLDVRVFLALPPSPGSGVLVGPAIERQGIRIPYTEALTVAGESTRRSSSSLSGGNS